MDGCTIRRYSPTHISNQEFFITSAGWILLSTGLAKIISALGKAQILDTFDPLFHLTFRVLFVGTGLFELTVSIICLTQQNRFRALISIAWIATCIALYRGGLWLTGWHRPCHCLGSFTDYLHISEFYADLFFKLVLLYLLLGSFYKLMVIWAKGKMGQRT